MSLRLGFHYHIPACQDSKGSLALPGYLGCFIDSLAGGCESLVCFLHSPLPEEKERFDYTIHSPNVTWVDLGPHTSVPRRMLNSHHFTKEIHSWAHRLDALLIRGPSPLLPAVAEGAGELPLALLLVGDYVAGIDTLKQPNWRKELIRLWSCWNKRQQMQVARRSLTFVNSRKLYEELQGTVSHLVEVRTTTLNEADFFERTDTCAITPYHLLYTGRMDRAKGLLEMVEAVALLSAQGEDIILDLVGWPKSGDTVMKEVQDLAELRGIVKRVVYHGFKALGPELFAYYKEADIYIIASKSSFEGFPRTIWEAMAHSLPVVATRVGSIPNFIEGSAELVEPGQPRALANGIAQVLHNPAARQKMISLGIALARANTLESQTGKMIKEIEFWVKRSYE